MLMYAVNYVKVLHSHQNYLCEGHHLSCILPSGYFLSSSFQHINILNLANCCLTEILSALGFHDGIVSLLSFEPLPLLFLFWILLHLIANVGVLLNSVMGQLIFPPCIFTLSDLISFSNFKQNLHSDDTGIDVHRPGRATKFQCHLRGSLDLIYSKENFEAYVNLFLPHFFLSL